MIPVCPACNEDADLCRHYPEPTPQERTMTSPTQRRHDELVALLTEICDRLPERVEVKVAPFDPDVIAANLEAIKHETETPMRGHGECCEPAPADVDPDEERSYHEGYHDGVSVAGSVARKAEAERDEWKVRYTALRADVEREYAESPDYPTARILDADDERGQA